MYISVLFEFKVVKELVKKKIKNNNKLHIFFEINNDQKVSKYSYKKYLY